MNAANTFEVPSHLEIDKWSHLLGSLFPASKVACVSHMWNAVENKGTSMRPTKRSGWLVAVAG